MRLSFFFLLSLVGLWSCSPTREVVVDCMSIARAGQYEKAKDCFESKPSLSEAEQLAYGASLIEVRQYPRALEVFEILLQDHPNKPTYLYYRGNAAEGSGNYVVAKESYERYLNTGSSNESWRKQANAFLRNLPMLSQSDGESKLVSTLYKLPEEINTEMPEFGASLTIDGRQMFFTRKVNGQEDLYHSELDSSGNWLESKPLVDINTEANEGAHFISPNGRLLVFTKCSHREGFGGCDLYWSELSDGQWSQPRNMGEAINSEYWESQPSLSANGKYLFFSSSRPQGEGARDIWVSVYRDNEGWSPAFNAGPQINSKGNEVAPFLHVDQRTLYFSSDFHPGHGGYDIFMTKNEGKSKWSAPKNLGPLINNTNDNVGFYVDWSGKTAFLHEHSIDGANTEVADIYQIDMIPEFSPIPVNNLRLQVYDAQSKQPIAEASVVILRTSDGKKLYKSLTDQAGQLLSPLGEQGSNVSVRIHKQGYPFYSAFYDLQDLNHNAQSFELTIYLDPIPTDKFDMTQPVVLNNVFFDIGKADVKPESRSELVALAEFLEVNEQLKIEISGHTDNQGSEEANQLLSQQRANAVRNELVTLGIEEARISAVGYGESKPVATNETNEGRLQNRRTEFMLLNE